LEERLEDQAMQTIKNMFTKRFIGVLLIILLLSALIPAFPQAVYAAGPSGCWNDNKAIDYTPGAVDTYNKVLKIYNEAELALFADDRDFDETLYDGWTVLLESDLDLGAHYWSCASNLINVTFNGKGHTIRGLHYHHNYNWSGFYDKDIGAWYSAAGLFGVLERSTVQNLTLENPVIEIPSGFRYCTGSVAGYVEGSRIRDITVNNPQIYMGESLTTSYIGAVAGYSRSTNTPISGKQPVSVITGVDVNGGLISVDKYGASIDSPYSADGSVVYLGGIVGANFASLVGSSSVKGTQLKSGSDVTEFVADKTIKGFFAGGIAGYTSMTEKPIEGTCLLNNFSEVKFAIDPALKATSYYVGGICGQVKNDDVANNLYFGDKTLFGNVSNTASYPYINDYNFRYANAAAAWAAQGGGGALYSLLNGDTNAAGAGLYTAAEALKGHRGGSIGEALARLKIWKTDNNHNPFFGDYYTPGSIRTVTFKDGTKTLYTRKVVNGDLVIMPVTPTKPAHTFIGWYTTNKYVTRFDFAKTKIIKDTTIDVYFYKNPTKVKTKTIKATSPKKKQAKITYGKVKNVTGYEIIFGLNKSTVKKATDVTKANKFYSGKKLSSVKKGLKSKKIYYFKIRAYKTVKGVKCYSGWTTIQKVKVK
jgi:hypothetical protein